MLRQCERPLIVEINTVLLNLAGRLYKSVWLHGCLHVHKYTFKGTVIKLATTACQESAFLLVAVETMKTSFKN